MNYRIPFHSLVIIISVNHAQILPEIDQIFPEHEIITHDMIRYNLWGDAFRPELSNVLFEELRHRISLKLSLGERVVVCAQNRNPDHRITLCNLAIETGAEVVYLIADPHDHRLRNDIDIASGDGIVDNVLRLGMDNIEIVEEYTQALDSIRADYRGLTVVGDVHGNLPGLEAAVQWAKGRDHYLWFLGDVIDYGRDSISTMDRIHRLIMQNDASMLQGNHERKIARYFSAEKKIKLSPGNRMTTDALDRLAVHDAGKWRGRFGAVVARSCLTAHLGDVVLAHGAVHPSVWSGKPRYREIEQFALYGESDQIMGGPFELTYRWVDEIPKDKLVIVGHDARASIPLTVTGRMGGQAIFLDTGSGKDGSLSSADLRFSSTGVLRLENFNRHD